MFRIEWHDNTAPLTADDPPSHVIASVKVGFNFFLFIDTDKKEIEREMQKFISTLPKDHPASKMRIVGEIKRVFDSKFILRVNPLNLFCSLITEIGATDEKKPH
jgi:hypothetical protein